MGFNEMRKHSNIEVSDLFGNLSGFLRIGLFRVLSMGPIPNHFAFIMDGNRRYAKKGNLNVGAGHRAGYESLVSVLKYCYELGVKYVTIYAFSIDNFKRRPDEVKDLMELMLEKIDELLKKESIVKQYGIRVYFIGNLKLLSENVRIAAKKVMSATAKNTKCTLLICVAYTSRDEIIHAVQESCKNKREEIQAASSCNATNGGIQEIEDCKKIDSGTPHAFQELQKDEASQSQATEENAACNGYGLTRFEESERMQGECSMIKLVDIEKYMYMAVAPEPDVMIRSSGETRLSNFLLWQSSNCMLYSPNALWPEIGLWHLVWAVLNFQRHHSYLEKKKKQV